VLKEKHYNNVTNVKKARIWSEINTKINSLGVAPRTLKEIKDKWKNLTSKAKSTFTMLKYEKLILSQHFDFCPAILEILIYLVLKWETCIILTNVCPWDVRYLVLL
jgi:hypothetical protein